MKLKAIVLVFLIFIWSSYAHCQEETTEQKATWAVEKIEEYINLKPSGPIEMRFLSDEQEIKDILRMVFDREWPENKLESLEILMGSLDVGSLENTDRDSLFEIWAVDRIGSYDDEAKVVYTVSQKIGKPFLREKFKNKLYKHEGPDYDYILNYSIDADILSSTANAVQDQNFDLLNMREKFRYNNDAWLSSLGIVMMLDGIVSEIFIHDLFSNEDYAMRADESFNWSIEKFAWQILNNKNRRNDSHGDWDFLFEDLNGLNSGPGISQLEDFLV